MTSSGVSVNKEVIEAHQRIKSGKNRPKYTIFKLNDAKTEIVFEKEEFEDKDISAEDNWKKFCDELPPDSPIFALYDLQFVNQEDQNRDKLLFVYWCPDCSPIKKKMVSASSKDALIKSLNHNDAKAVIQACDSGDLDMKEVLERVSGKQLVQTKC